MTTIRYFIPEDGDIEARPNVFLAPKPRTAGAPPTLGQIKQALPLEGRYHYRFKAPLVPGADREREAMPVWMDCTDDRQPVPTWRNTIVAKLTRIGVEDDDDDFDRTPSVSVASTPVAPTPAPQPTADLFDAGGLPSAPNSGGYHTQAGNNLFDMNTPPQQQHATPVHQQQPDLFGTPAAPPQNSYYPQQQAPNTYHRQQSGQSNTSNDAFDNLF